VVGGELPRDLSEAVAGGILDSDSIDDIDRERGVASWP
jgi:hypothetical protein